MQALPHVYQASASARKEGEVTVHAEAKASIVTGPPVEFGGSGEQWSPEELLLAAVADCFLLSFKALARATRFDWQDISCVVDGTLDKVERAIQFTGMRISVTLVLDAAANEVKARRLLEKAEQLCLITNSLKLEPELQISLQNAGG